VALKMAEAYGCDRMVYHGWPQDGKYKNLDAIKHTVEVYNEVSASLKADGLRFGLHNHWWEFEETGSFYPAYYLLENLNPDIFFEIDVYWVKTGGQVPVKVVRDFGRRAPLLHIKDGLAQKGDIGYRQVPAGDGTVDFPSVVKAGGKNIEWMIVEFDEYEHDIFEGVQKSYTYLTKNRLAKGKI
jgi:sugar phosphate isomerase/epimerase